MKRLTLILCCWLALLGVALAEDVKVDANRIVRLKADLTSPDDLVFWSIDKEDSVDAEELPGGKLYFAAPPGTYRVKCVVVPVKDGKIAGGQRTSRYVVTVGAPGPTPPGPGPTPPGPTPPGPAPGPAPIPDAGFRALVVYETADLPKMTPAQQNVLYARAVRDYLDAKAVLGPDGKTHEWRMYDKDVDLGAESAVWRNAVKRARESKDFKTPWLIISNPEKGTGYEGPLPADVNAMLELLKKHGG
jgi:hypothetical protein